MTIFENIQSVRARIESAAQRSGRDPAGVGLVAVSKYANLEQIREALSSGLIRQIGESRVQDAAGKAELLRAEFPGVRWRMIGHLQSNKAAKAAAVFDAVDALDSMHTAQALHKACRALGRSMPVLLQLNLGNPGQRGLPEGELGPFLESLRPLDGVKPEGLMAIGPQGAGEAELRAAFKKARTVFESLFGRARSNEAGGGPYLSLGMSGDFEVAVEEGANLLRIGSAIFPPQAVKPQSREGT